LLLGLHHREHSTDIATTAGDLGSLTTALLLGLTPFSREEPVNMCSRLRLELELYLQFPKHEDQSTNHTLLKT
jgi:hypothetical protein